MPSRLNSRGYIFFSLVPGIVVLLAASTRLPAQPVSGPSSHQLAGTWTFSDAGATIQYVLSEDLTFRAHSAITAPDYPHFALDVSGSYTLSGDTIMLTPQSGTANGEPANLVIVTGRYDAAADQLLLKPETATGYSTYIRGSSNPLFSNSIQPSSSTLPGVLLVALILGGITTLFLSLGIIAAYKHTVERAMRPTLPNDEAPAFAPRPHDIQEGQSNPRGWEQQSQGFLLYARSRVNRLAMVYSAAGLACACILTFAFLLEAQVRSPLAILIFLAIFSWPVILCWNHVAAWNFRTRRRNELIYAALIVALGLVSHSLRGTNSFVQVGMAFLVANLLVTLLILAFSLSAVRSVGPCILALTTSYIAGAWVTIHVVATHSSTVLLLNKWTDRLRLGVYSSVIIACFLIVLVFLPLGWFVMSLIVRSYNLNRGSDQSVQVDSIWLLFSLVQGIIICTPSPGSSGRGVVLGMLAFPVYLTVRSIGFAWLRKSDVAAIPGISLLYLRRFHLRGRTEQLFRAVTLFWRVAGDVRLIGGPDLARSTIQPHTLFNFLRRKVNQSFIGSNEALDRQIANFPRSLDPDTRFRVTDFFCLDHMWRAAVTSLMIRSHVVLADFRGFTSKNKGALYEIRQLLHLVPIGRILILADTAEANDYLSDSVATLWRELPSTSPNYSSRHELPEVVLRVDSDRGILGVLEALFSLPERSRGNS